MGQWAALYFEFCIRCCSSESLQNSKKKNTIFCHLSIGLNRFWKAIKIWCETVFRSDHSFNRNVTRYMFQKKQLFPVPASSKYFDTAVRTITIFSCIGRLFEIKKKRMISQILSYKQFEGQFQRLYFRQKSIN